MGANAARVDNNLNNKYGQKLVDTAKKSATDVLKIAGKKSNSQNSGSKWGLAGNFIADKITRVSKKSQQVNHTQIWLAMKYQKKDIYLHKKDKKLLMN